MEKENAALRARVNRLERPKRRSYSTVRPRKPNPALASAAATAKRRYLGRLPCQSRRAPISNAPRFEVSGSLLFLQPGAGNLEYGTLVTPFPHSDAQLEQSVAHAEIQSCLPFGARYMPNEFNDIELSWTHLNTTTNGSFSGTPTQMVGPPFLIGPEANEYKIGQGSVKFAYDSVKLDGGHTFCAECSFQLRAFGGVEFARISQNLTGTFLDPDGSASMSYTTPSMFTGAGPRLGLKGQYDLGNFQFIGEFAGAGLIGTSQARINFSTISPALVGPNNQSLTSPNATQVVPSIDARLATAYAFPPTNYGQFKIEVGLSSGGLFRCSQSVFTDLRYRQLP